MNKAFPIFLQNYDEKLYFPTKIADILHINIKADVLI